MRNKLKALVIGAGDRGRGFAKRLGKLEAEVIGIADTSETRRNFYANGFGVQNIYSDGKQALSDNQKYDFVYIATPDNTHYDLAIQAIKGKNHLILEKPIATTPEDCVGIIKAQKNSDKMLSVAHVLRYAPLFQSAKKVVQSGELGKLLGIDLTENVGYWHFAHSYVRGNWRKEETGPIILTKSCHDMDILSWLANDKAKSVSSNGSLVYFKKENAPEGSKKRCTDGCNVKDCPYDAQEFYLNLTDKEANSHPFNTISSDHSEKGRRDAIETGPYGECVFRGKNDVCDNQNVSIMFRNGIPASFRLRATKEDMSRQLQLRFEKGEFREI